MDITAKSDTGNHPVTNRYICILFKCCSVYQRIYINKAKTAYVGWCPKCAANVEVKIGPDGVDTRFFEAK